MSLHSGERQVAPTIAGIRRDHVARYEWAAQVIDSDSIVCDFGCGVGYGSHFFAKDYGFVVDAIDSDGESVAFARQNFAHPLVKFIRRNEPTVAKYDCYVCFETLEHIQDPARVLQAMLAHRLLASVPNETVYPHSSLVNKQHHVRHYTKAQFEELLNSCGWTVQAWWTQDGPDSEVRPGDNGMTLIVDAVRG